MNRWEIGYAPCSVERQRRLYARDRVLPLITIKPWSVLVAEIVTHCNGGIGCHDKRNARSTVCRSKLDLSFNPFTTDLTRPCEKRGQEQAISRRLSQSERRSNEGKRSAGFCWTIYSLTSARIFSRAIHCVRRRRNLRCLDPWRLITDGGDQLSRLDPRRNATFRLSVFQRYEMATAIQYV